MGALLGKRMLSSLRQTDRADNRDLMGKVRRKPILEYLIVILGRELSDLKISCFQVQLEHANETHFGFKIYINLFILTEAKPKKPRNNPLKTIQSSK